MKAERRLITVELDAGGPPISGSVHIRGADDRSFAGWIGLLAALDELIGTGAEEVSPGGELA